MTINVTRKLQILIGIKEWYLYMYFHKEKNGYFCFRWLNFTVIRYER